MVGDLKSPLKGFKLFWFGPQVGSYALSPLYCTEPVFLNVYGAPELIPRNEFRQPM